MCLWYIENANYNFVALNDSNALISKYLNESFQIGLIEFDALQTIYGYGF